MTQPYGKPYTVRGWGDEVVTTVAIDDARELVEGYTHVVRGTVPGPVILVPTAALTPVDTTPAEPEPGAWLIGGVLAVRFAEGEDWIVDSVDGLEWRSIWDIHGGPDVPIVRLVPAPADVTLPWHAYDGDGSLATVRTYGDRIRIAVSENPQGSGDDTAAIEYRADTATRMAAALLCAAREATS